MSVVLETMNSYCQQGDTGEFIPATEEVRKAMKENPNGTVILDLPKGPGFKLQRYFHLYNNVFNSSEITTQ